MTFNLDLDLGSADVTPESVLGEVRRANLQGRLYPDPDASDVTRREALDALAAELQIEPVPASATSLRGWFATGVAAPELPRPVARA